MWTASGTIKRANENFLKSKIPTSFGKSGSPMIKRVEGEEYIIGVHIGSKPEEERNFGVRLNEEKMKMVNKWVEEIFDELKFAKTSEKWGKEEWSNGHRYEGEFKDNKRNGKGVYYWPSGARYEGEFKDGQENGKGVHYWPDGHRYEGEFKDGQENGKGVYYWPDGDW